MKYVNVIFPFFMKNISFYSSIKRVTVNHRLFYSRAVHKTTLSINKCNKTQSYEACMAMVNYNHFFLKVDYGYLQKSICRGLNYLNNSPNKVLTLVENTGFIKEGRFHCTSFVDLLFNEERLTVTEWDSLKQLLLEYRYCDGVNFSGKMMNIIYLKMNYGLGESLLEYLREKKQEPNVATLSAYLQLCRYYVGLCGDEAILNAYKNIISKVNILDSTTRSSIVQALCVTSYWMIAYDIVKKIESVVSECENYCVVASAAFKHNRTDIALEFVQKIESLGEKINEEVYIRWLEAALSNQSELRQLLEQLLTHLGCKEVLLPVTCVNKLQECFKSLENGRWISKLVNINRKGVCPNCNHQLPCIDITPDQFNKLKDAVLCKMIKNVDVYLKWIADDVNEFFKFVEQTAPYDLIIHAPSLSTYRLKDGSKVYSLQLYQVVKHFARNKNMKILVLGNVYMKKWPRIHMDAIEQMAHVFYIEKRLYNKAFMIYAAVYSGQKTLVMRNDLLWEHKTFLQDPTVAMYFECWRSNHQIFLEHVDKETGRIDYKEPYHHGITAQENTADSYHIPYDDNKEPDPSDICEQWLCCRKIN